MSDVQQTAIAMAPCSALVSLAAEGHLAAARLRGLDDSDAAAAVIADFDQRIAAAQAVAAGGPG